jgi:membrane fusion protein (multidrug efflux system)
MDVEFSVPSVELFSMRDMEARGRAQSYGQGSPASLRLLEGVEYDTVGKVVFLDTQVEAETSAVRAKARFPNPQGQLLPGQFVAVRVGGAFLVKAVMLPQEAVMQTESGPSVYVLDEESKAERRPVVLGPAFGSEFLVESGLEAGQRVIVQGQDKVRAGQKVTARALEQKGRNAKPGEVPALMAPGSSNSPSKRGNVEDAPAPVFEESNSDSSVERKGGAR